MQDESENSPLPVTPSSVAGAPPAAMPAETLTATPANPAWASDLRKLYNSVVEEPLPECFMALLSQLDTDD